MKSNVLFLGCTQEYGYQFSAANTKTEFLYKGLSDLGDCCCIHNGVIGSTKVKERTCISKNGIENIITYPLRINKLLSFVFNIKLLYKDVYKYKKKELNNIIILELPDYHIFILYWFIARILKYKIVVISQEWGLSVKSIHFLRKPSVWLFSKTFGYFADGILPISEFIISKIVHFKKPYLKIPVLSNFDVSSFEMENNTGHNYFLYCVYAAYTRVIFFIIESIKKYNDTSIEKKELVLVLSGNSHQIKIVEDYISDCSLGERIIVKTKVPYQELISLYKNASALIVPLDPYSEQDKARFSQKIAEYLSSATPIITNAVGEINYYFKPNYDIIIVPKFTTDSYCEIFKWVDKNMEQSRIIGKRGYETGVKFFDYKDNAKLLSNFLKNI